MGTVGMALVVGGAALVCSGLIFLFPFAAGVPHHWNLSKTARSESNNTFARCAAIAARLTVEEGPVVQTKRSPEGAHACGFPSAFGLNPAIWVILPCCELASGCWDRYSVVADERERAFPFGMILQSIVELP
jgi:hypothetical protein